MLKTHLQVLGGLFPRVSLTSVLVLAFLVANLLEFRLLEHNWIDTLSFRIVSRPSIVCVGAIMRLFPLSLISLSFEFQIFP